VFRRQAWIAIFLLAASASVLGGCENQDARPIATMQAMAESHLPPFPGATLISTGSMPWKQSLELGTTGAYVTRTFGTDADESAVIAYYQTQLQPLGWTRGCSVCDVWQKPGYEFRIDQEYVGSHPEYRPYPLVFSEVLSQETSVSPPPASGAP
jgi:hypothetical protein